MNFLLEVENRQLRTKVAEAIRGLGGHVLDSFDEHEPFAVISDHSFAPKLEKEKETRNTNEKVRNCALGQNHLHYFRSSKLYRHCYEKL